MTIARTFAIAAAALVGVVLSVAQPAAAAPSPATPEAAQKQVAGFWVGPVRGTDIFLAISVSKTGRVLAYVCDGKPRKPARNYGWLSGRAVGNHIDLRAKGMRLQADLTSGWAKGTLRLANGKTFRFDAKPARGPANVYWLPGDRGFAWVVINDGRVRGGGSSGKLANACARLDNQIKQQQIKVDTMDRFSQDFENAVEDLEQLVDMFIDFCQ